MTTRTTDAKLAPVQSLGKRPTNSSGRSRNPNAVAPSTDASAPSTAAVSSHSANTIVSRNELGQKSRIVVVRTIDQGGEEDGTKTEGIREAKNSGTVRIPAVLTDGQTSVYLIRRPIPQTEPSRETKYYKTENDSKSRNPKTTTTTTRTGHSGAFNNVPLSYNYIGNPENFGNYGGFDGQADINNYNNNPSSNSYSNNEKRVLANSQIPVAPSPPPRAMVTPPPDDDSLAIVSRPSTPKDATSSGAPVNPNVLSGAPIQTRILTIVPPGATPPEKVPAGAIVLGGPRIVGRPRGRPKKKPDVKTDGESEEASDRERPRSRSRSKSRSRNRNLNLIRRDSQDESGQEPHPRGRRRRPGKNHPQSSTPQEEGNNTDQNGNNAFPSRLRNTGVQADLNDSEAMIDDSGRRTNIRSLAPRGNQRVKSSKPIVMVNPDDRTIAVVENPYSKEVKATSINKAQRRIRKTQAIHNTEYDSVSTEKLVESHRTSGCLGCLSRHMCLVVVICCILLLIGLAGVGVGAYFLASDSQSNVVPKIVGIAIGGAIALAALCFLCCVLGCVGYREGWFSSSSDQLQSEETEERTYEKTYEKTSEKTQERTERTSDAAYATMAQSHPNARIYAPREHSEPSKIAHLVTSNPVTVVPVAQRPVYVQQRSADAESNGATNTKNIIIHMPERLLTGRQVSPKTHERKINNVVNNIGRIVEDAKKRYNGDIPDKVIVKVDENAKPVN